VENELFDFSWCDPNVWLMMIAIWSVMLFLLVAQEETKTINML
jgi:hypothetical protein